jgi:hypothetical protein
VNGPDQLTFELGLVFEGLLPAEIGNVFEWNEVVDDGDALVVA